MMVLAAQAPPPLLLLSPSGNGDGYAEGRGLTDWWSPLTGTSRHVHRTLLVVA